MTEFQILVEARITYANKIKKSHVNNHEFLRRHLIY